jgi:hypothetical protein
MKKALLIMMVLLGFITAYAEDYSYLTIVEQNGTKTSMTAVGLSLSFSNGKLTASNAYTGESKVIALKSLVSMYFSNADETTELKSLLVDHSEADAVYTLQGQKQPTSRQLPKGIYIIRKGKETRKMQVR